MASALFFVFLYVLTFLQSSTPVKGIELLYCSPLNTGSDFDTVISDFQSNGRCRETCIGKYSFAILQGKSCWCSDAVPGDITDVSDCSDSCPGYPKDKCGSVRKRLYGYIQLDKRPTTTIAGSTTSLTGTPSLSSSSSLSSPSSTSFADQVTVTVTLTQTGSPTTFFTSTKSSLTTNPTSSETSSVSNLNGGQIAGIVIGSLAGFGIIIALIFLIVRAHRRRERQRSQRNELFNPFHEPAVPTPVFRPHLTTEKPPAQSFLRVPNSRDTRLKNGIYPNGSRRSNVSLQDHQDYSRPVLRLTNPDPPSSD
ncbi:YlTSR1 [Coccidioides immitis H538.4]|uniref:YlTSR1 n=1 Tax=Coccidioides immitis H538.4 TaxID=396776 RepID=A0A0J8RH84_COCIT|nr:YlTSR1 [Coccidioides immitis H538.4]